MRTFRGLVSVSFVVVALVAGCSSGDDGGSADAVVSGPWHGEIQIPDHPIEVGVTFADDGSATIDIPEQDISGMVLQDVRTDDGEVSFTLPEGPGDPGFTGTLEGEEITGQWSQAGQQVPLTMTPGEAAGPPRPQEPEAPFPYAAEDVTYDSGDLTIAGTLTKPEGDGPFPGVLMVTGSGPQDRDETLAGHRPFLLIADSLTRAGYAVLRTDDRGVGGTGGDLNSSTYDDLTGDALAGLEFLKDRPEIDAGKVGIFGHSEGGYLAPKIAAEPDAGVAFAILMAGPSVPGADVLIEQTKEIGAVQGMPQADIDEQIGFFTEWTRLLDEGDTAGARELAQQQNAELPEGERSSEQAIDQLNSPYMTSFVTYDPAPALQQLQVPVLAFFGGSDLQVLPSQNEQPMRDLLAGNPDATVHTFPGLNHLMQPSETGSPSEYATIETTVDPAVLDYVTDWITEEVPVGE